MILQKLISEVENLIEVRKGGKGSGNFGHAGIPGKIGGSASGGSGKGGGMGLSPEKLKEKIKIVEQKLTKANRDLEKANNNYNNLRDKWIKSGSGKSAASKKIKRDLDKAGETLGKAHADVIKLRDENKIIYDEWIKS